MHHSMRSQGTYITIYVLQVPYDAHLEDLFFGEEMLMSLLLWRSGYAFFAPCDASMRDAVRWCGASPAMPHWGL